MPLDIVLVPNEVGADPENPYWKPIVPESLNRPLAFGQASSAWKSMGKSLLWTRATPEELDEIARIPGASVIGRAASDAEADSMQAAFTTQPPKWGEKMQAWEDIKAVDRKYAPGETRTSADISARAEAVVRHDRASVQVRQSHKTAEAEFVAAYRALAVVEEAKLRAQRGVLDLAVLATLLGLTLGQVFRAIVHQDNFTGSDGSIGTQGGPAGRTMSDSLGQWFVDRGNCNITSNELAFNDNTNARAYDSNSTGIDYQDVYATLRVAPSGVLTRRATSSTNYIGRWTGAVTQLREDAGGANGQLGSNGTNAAVGDVMNLLSTGDAHTLKINGSTVVGPETDSSKATGSPGACGDGAGGNIDLGKIDDWRWEDAGGGASAVPVFMHNYRRRRIF